MVPSAVQLSASEARELAARVEQHFAVAGSRPVWERFHQPGISHRFDDGRAFERLSAIVPDAGEHLLLFALGDIRGWRGSVEALAGVIATSFAFEYLVVPFDTSWLLCENHHDVLIAIGEPVESRLRGLVSGL